jgi:hypothetical protein
MLFSSEKKGMLCSCRVAYGLCCAVRMCLRAQKTMDRLFDRGYVRRREIDDSTWEMLEGAVCRAPPLPAP